MLEETTNGRQRGISRTQLIATTPTLQAWLAKRPPKAALEPELPIIDPHHHLWHTPTRGLYFLPELMADLGGGHKIISTVFLECQSMFRAGGPDETAPVGEVEFVDGTGGA